MLDELLRRDKLVCVRHEVEDDPDDDWLIRDSSMRGVRMLAEGGLTYDLLVKPRHLRRIPILAEKVPELRMMLDHIAKPLIGDGVLEPWASDQVRVADIPNVYCKISGMVTEADQTDWTVDDLKPYATHVVELSGFDRVMFGREWSVCHFVASYQQALDASLESVGPMSDTERAGFLARNASRFYNLQD